MPVIFINVASFYIVKWQTCERAFTTTRGSLFIWSLALASPPLIGRAEYRFISRKSFGFVYFQSDVRYMYFMIAKCFFGPPSVMALPYFRILSFKRDHKRRLATFRNRINVTEEAVLAPPNAGCIPRLRMSDEETKITHTLVIFVECFVFC